MKTTIAAAAVLLLWAATSAHADEHSRSGAESYRIQQGDVLTVAVWKEPELRAEVLVRPDGGMSFPLAGDVNVLGKSIDQLRTELQERLKTYIPDPVVTVAIKEIGGNQIYVLGKVNRPGQFPFSRAVDVMQALSLAGGTTPYAAVNDIVILRRQNDRVEALSFRYSDVEHGKDLAQNVLLRSGDTVVVP